MNIIAPKEYSAVTPILLVRGPTRISGVAFDVCAHKPWAYVVTFDPTDRYSCGGVKRSSREIVLPTLCPAGKDTRVIIAGSAPPHLGLLDEQFGYEVMCLDEGHSFAIFAWGEDLAFKKIQVIEQGKTT